MKLSLPLAVCCTAAAITIGALFVGADERDAVPSPYTPAPAPTAVAPASTPAAPGAAPVTAAPAAPPTGEVVIADFAFSGPAVALGATVNVRNNDSAPHTVTGDGFDVEVGGGASGAFTAPAAPGTYSYTCLIHPTMTGSLVVQ
jgi:plastocyanin